MDNRFVCGQTSCVCHMCKIAARVNCKPNHCNYCDGLPEHAIEYCTKKEEAENGTSSNWPRPSL